MKGYLLVIIFISICNFLTGQNNPDALAFEVTAHEVQKPDKIDVFDTVIFSMCKVTRVGDFVDFPVTIKADDQINALDFSIKFNHNNLSYDTVINHTNYIQLTEYYNPIDATLRVTSNSFTSYDKDTIKVMSIRFKVLSQKLSGADLNTIFAYLNGDRCSIKLLDTDCHVVTANKNLNYQQKVNVYPNPAKDFVVIEVPGYAKAELFDVNGQKLLFRTSFNSKLNMPLEDIPDGIYLLKTSNENFHTVTKLMINQ